MSGPELPVVPPATHERADAARNRERILSAAARLFARDGAHTTSMEAIAVEAGVGKGTLFRRFGDRASLMFALLDQTDRALQEAILRGPPPLGPGAPPRVRLVAFGDAMLDRLERDSDLLLEVEGCQTGAWQRSAPYAAMWLHVRSLLAAAGVEGDTEYLADVLMAALTPATFHHQRHTRGVPLERVKAGFAGLVGAIIPD